MHLKIRGFSISVLQIASASSSSLRTIPPVPQLYHPKMKFTGLAFLGTIAASTAQVVIVPTGPVKGPNTLVFKEIGGVPNNECLTFTNNVCSPPT